MPRLHDACGEVEGFLEVLIEEYDILSRDYDDVRASYDDLQDELTGYQNENEELRSRISENPDEVITIITLQREIEELKNTVIELTLRLEGEIGA